MLEADWRRKMIDPVGQVWTPFGHARGDVYSYSDAADPTTLKPIPDDTVLRGVAAAGVLYSYPFVAHTASASHVIAPTAQIIARQNKVDQRRLPDEDAKSLMFDDTLLFDIDKFSGYDRFETGTRANLGAAVHLPGQQRRLWARRVRPELPPGGREPLRQSGPGPDRSLQLLAGQRPRDQPLGLRRRPLSVAVHGRQRSSPRARFDEKDWSLRRQDAMVTASYGPMSGSLAYTFTLFDPITGLLEKQQEVIASLSLAADRQLERCRARCATTSMRGSASRIRPALPTPTSASC